MPRSSHHIISYCDSAAPQQHSITYSKPKQKDQQRAVHQDAECRSRLYWFLRLSTFKHINEKGSASRTSTARCIRYSCITQCFGSVYWESSTICAYDPRGDECSKLCVIIGWQTHLFLRIAHYLDASCSAKVKIYLNVALIWSIWSPPQLWKILTPDVSN